MSAHHVAAAAFAFLLVVPTLASGQSEPVFGRVPVDVISEWRGQDRGDGSGSYSLVTTVTDPGTRVVLRHELSEERDVEGKTKGGETLEVLEGGHKRHGAGSDPSVLGPYADTAMTWALPFDLEFAPEARANYRPQGKLVTQIVRSVVPEAKVTAKSGTDGRTTASVQIPEVQPVDVLAQYFVAIRKALDKAEIGLARLVLKGTATAPDASSAAVGSPAPAAASAP